MRLAQPFVTLIGAFTLFSVPLHAGDVLPKSEVDRFVKPVMEGHWAKGLVVGLINERDRQIIGYGIKSDANPTLPDAQTVFEIGSVTKTFTATLLALRVERGEVQLDDPVQKLLPDRKLPHGKGDRPITLVQLSTHSSGLPRMPSNFFPADPGNPYADYSEKLLFDYLALLNLPMEPGEHCLYSNLGVGLLGEALSAHAKKSYEDLLLDQHPDYLRRFDAPPSRVSV
jgi:CubicO group peptidase (beta-lactamase class C family)